MPSKEELTDQLTLMTKLAAQVERMAASTEKLESSYSQQIDAVQKLAAALGQVNTQGAVQNVDVLSKSLKDMQAKMKDIGKTSEKAFQTLGKKVEETGKTMSQKFPKSVAIGAAALIGFVQGTRNLVSLTKGVVGFFASFVDGAFSIAAAIIAIPFKIFESLVDTAARSAGGMSELMVAIENLRKEFGFLYGPTNKAIIDVSKSLKGFKDTGLSAWRVFGMMHMRLELLQKVATEMGATFTYLRDEFEKNGGALLAYQKGLGLSEELMKSIAQYTISMGDTLGDTFKEMTKYSLGMAKAFGLDAKVISRDMGKAIMDVKHFAGATIQEIAQAATYARKLGLELDKVVGTLDTFETFDTAAENVAKLSQSFGVQIDAFELMKAQDPAEQIDMLRKSFAKAGVDSSNFNRQQLKLLSTTTGLDEATARQAFSMKNQGMGLDAIKKKGSDVEKKTLTQAQAMERLADAIERLVMPGGQLLGSYWDQFILGVKNGLQSTKDFWGMMINIRIGLRDVYFIGVQLGRVLEKIIPGLGDIFGGLKEFFAPKYFDKLFRSISDSVKKFFDPNSAYKDSIPTLIENLQNCFFDMVDEEGPNARRILDGFKTFFSAFSKIAVVAIGWLSHQIADGMKDIADLISGKKSLTMLSSVGSAANGGLGFLAEIFLPLGQALKDAWKTLQGPLFSLLDTIGKQVWKYLTSDEMIERYKKYAPYVAAVLFGPGLVRAGITTLAMSLASVAGGLASTLVGGVFKKLGVKILGDMFDDIPTSGVSKSINTAIKSAFGGVSATGADVGSKIGTSAIVKMTSGIGQAADGFAKALGASNFGSVLGGVIGVAAAAYIGIEGKKLIDETFDKGKRSDKSLRGAEMEAWSATSAQTPMEKKLQQIDKLQKTIAEQQEALNTKGFGEKALNWIAGTDIAADQAADALAKSKRTLSDLQMQVKQAEQSNAGTVEAARKKMASSFESQKFMGDTTLDDAKGKLQSLEDLSKKLMGKNFDIQKMINGVKDKFKGISFDIFSPEQAGSLGANVEVMNQLQTYVNALCSALAGIDKLKQFGERKMDLKSLQNVKAIVSQMMDTSLDLSQMVTKVEANTANFQKNVMAFTDVIKGDEKGRGGISGALMAVSDMVAQTNELNKALGSIGKIDIKTKLQNVANAVGLGSKVSYTVNPNKQVQVVINLEVTMDVDEVEKVMIMRQKSIIADRLNFATGENAGQPGTPAIPQSYVKGQPLPNITPSGNRTL